MLLCNIEDIAPGAVLGASVLHPNASVDTELLKAGVELDHTLLRRLKQLGIRQLWIEHDLTRDLDRAATIQLTETKLAVYRQLRDDIGRMSNRSITVGQVQSYRQSISELVFQLIGSGKYAGMSDQLFATGGSLFTHCTNVAYLAVLIGLELEDYIIRERQRLSPEHARDLIPLGLGAMLHDIGKVGMKASVADHHEIMPTNKTDDEQREYASHPLAGYRLLHESRAPASAMQAVLNHHQRWDGQGWPETIETSVAVRRSPQSNRGIHIFTRIVSAANVLDNLLSDAAGSRRPPVAALHELASSRFDGWFDPVVRRAALKRIPPFAVGSQVRLNDNRDAVVIAPNLKSPCRPTVRLLQQTGDEKQATTIDLADQPELYVCEYTGIRVDQWLFDLPPAQMSDSNTQAA